MSGGGYGAGGQEVKAKGYVTEEETVGEGVRRCRGRGGMRLEARDTSIDRARYRDERRG